MNHPARRMQDREEYSGIGLRERLILTIVIVGVLMTIPTVYALLQLKNLEEIADTGTRRNGAAYASLGRFMTGLAEANRHEGSYIVTPEDGSFRSSRDSALADAHVQLLTLDTIGYAEVAAPAKAQLDEIEAGIRQIDQLLTPVPPATAPTMAQRTAATTAFQPVKQRFAESEQIIKRIGSAIDEETRIGNQRAREISANAARTTAVALALCLVIALAIGSWMTRQLLRPVAQLRHFMARVAGGSFVVPEDLPYQRSDEIGDLSRSFRGMTRQLADLDQLKAEFMSISTHELKTPINVIGGYAELIQEGVYGRVNDKQNGALTAIREQARVLTQMVTQLLDVSRIEAGGLRLEMHDVAVRELFDRVHRTFSALAEKQDITFEVVLDENAPETVPGDADRLRDQVLGNLISNAFKFTPTNGAVLVRGWEENGWLCICVRDTGSGIPEEQQPHIFDKFYQVGGQARSKGAGLGLTIAYEVVQGHGGELTVESNPGEGTTFQIRLPLTREQAVYARTQLERRVDDRAAAAAAESTVES